MSLYTFTINHQLPDLKMPEGLHIEECNNKNLLALMASTTEEEVARRLENEHVAFVAYIHHQPAAFGWMAKRKALIGELNHEIILPAGHRYLWNFRTMESFRGLGIYPALLQYIIRYEGGRVNRFLIIHAPENKSSLSGIQKAGFQHLGKLYSSNGITTIENTMMSQSSRSLLEELSIAVSLEEAKSCWNCSSPHLKKRQAMCCCGAAGVECVGGNLQVLAA